MGLIISLGPVTHEIVQLNPNDNYNYGTFNCGNTALNNWIKTQAKQATRKDYSRTYIFREKNIPNIIIGYYCLSAYYVTNHTIGKMPNHIPAVKLGQLAIDLKYQGNRIGNLLIADSLLKTQSVRNIIGVKLLLVDAIYPEVVPYYLNLGFYHLLDPVLYPNNYCELFTLII